MKNIFLTLSLACLTSLIFAEAIAEDTPAYQQSGKAATMSWPSGKWDGKHQFKNIYCATFPISDKAQELQSAMFNQNTINLSSVDYENYIRAAIVVSSVPPDRSAEEEVSRIFKNEKTLNRKLA